LAASARPCLRGIHACYASATRDGAVPCRDRTPRQRLSPEPFRPSLPCSKQGSDTSPQPRAQGANLPVTDERGIGTSLEPLCADVFALIARTFRPARFAPRPPSTKQAHVRTLALARLSPPPYARGPPPRPSRLPGRSGSAQRPSSNPEMAGRRAAGTIPNAPGVPRPIQQGEACPKRSDRVSHTELFSPMTTAAGQK